VLGDLLRLEVESPRTLWATRVKLHLPHSQISAEFLSLVDQWRLARSCSGVWHRPHTCRSPSAAKVYSITSVE
jgi:hypothetical protein